jgi:hypothetical protein
MWSQVKMFLCNPSDKRAVSIMVGYVLLVTSAVIMGVIVYQWIRTYVPTEALECPEGVSIFLKEYSYDCGVEELTATLKNNGRFNLAGYFIHATNNTNQELATIDLSGYTSLGEGKGGTVLFTGTTNSFEPSDEKTHVFDLRNSGIGQIYSIEIVPVRFQEEEGKQRFTSCGNAKVEEMIHCGGECTIDCVEKECGNNGCGGSCGSCSGTDVCNSEGQCIPEGECTDTCETYGYECGTWTICGEETPCLPGCEIGVETCDEGTCISCTPDCGSRECGPAPNGCGGENACGTCDGNCIDGECIHTEVTLLEDGFEGSDWDAKWDSIIITNWDRANDKKHSGSYSARNTGDPVPFILGDDDLISDNLNALNANKIQISFWYNKDDLENGDFYIQAYDGSKYNDLQDLDTYAGPNNCAEDSGDDKWCKFEKTLTDSKYFKSNFRLKFEGTGTDFGERVWIDDVKIVKS